MINKKSAKKYYSSSEAIEFLNISAHQLRYLEKNLLDLNIYKIKNRRYYTIENLENIKNYIVNNKKTFVKQVLLSTSQRIDKLIKNFDILAGDITKFLANFYTSI